MTTWNSPPIWASQNRSSVDHTLAHSAAVFEAPPDTTSLVLHEGTLGVFSTVWSTSFSGSGFAPLFAGASSVGVTPEGNLAFSVRKASGSFDGDSWVIFGLSGQVSVGNVSGPSSSTAGDLATFSGTTGKVIADSGASVAGILASAATAAAVGDASTLSSADAYADTKSAAALASAKTYADTGDATTLASSKTYADSHDATTLASAKTYADAGDATNATAIATKAPSARNLTAGAGLSGGGDLSADRTFNVGANADGSIVVNADDVQVGVLATDAQHGPRSGGTLHAIATGFAAGFLSAADKTKLDGIASGATALALSSTTPAALGTAAVGTGTTAARADHVHQAPANVVAAGAAGLMTGSDKSKLDGIASGATALALSSTTPPVIGTAAIGTGTTAARADHSHSGAPVDAQYVCLVANGTLTNERVLSVDGTLTLADGGTGQPVTLSQKVQSLANKALSIAGWATNPANICWRFQDVYPVQNQVATGGAIADNVWIIDVQAQLPETATSMTKVELFLQGATGHAGLPTTMPQMELRAYSTAGGIVSYFTQSDASANTTAYQTAHSIVWAGSFSLALGSRHVLLVTGENGTNFLTGLKITGLTITVAFT